MPLSRLHKLASLLLSNLCGNMPVCHVEGRLTGITIVSEDETQAVLQDHRPDQDAPAFIYLQIPSEVDLKGPLGFNQYVRVEGIIQKGSRSDCLWLKVLSIEPNSTLDS